MTPEFKSTIQCLSFTILVMAILTLNACATDQVPTRVANTYEVAGKVYCDTPIFHNIESMVVRWIKATVAPEWNPVCSDRREE
jgi:hypothetical protein